MRRVWLWVAALAAVWTTQAVAAEPPALRLATAAAVSPSQAQLFYGTSTLHSKGAAAWATVAPEIAAQARSLGAGRLSADDYAAGVLAYVRDNIATEFRYGLGKGARGALIDQSGTAFDQAELVVELLRQGGLTASYQLGTISPSAAQFGRWTGLVTGLDASGQTFDVSAKAACRFLADGGIPALVNGGTDCASLAGAVGSLSIAHVWVVANGKLYDPSFKQGRLWRGIDVVAAMKCGTAGAQTCGAGLRAGALGARTSDAYSISGVRYVQNLNEGGVNGWLDQAAKDLQHEIERVERFAPLQQIVGGVTPDLSFAPAPGATLPYTFDPSGPGWSGGIPDQYRTKVTSSSCTGVLMYADELAGRRLKSIPRFEKSGGVDVGVLRADRITLSSCASGSGTAATLAIDSPFAANGGAYGDETVSVAIGLTPRTYLVQLGEAREGTVRSIAAQEAADPAQYSGVAGQEGTCTAPDLANQRFRCRNDHAPAVGANILSQQSLVRPIEEAATATRIRHLYRLGVIAQQFSAPKEEVKPYTDLISIAGAVAVTSNGGSDADAAAAFRVHAYVSSMLEGSVPQQEADTWEPLSGALNFVLNNRHGQRIFYVPAAKLTELVATLPNQQANNTDLQPLAAAQYDLVIPESMIIPCFDIPDPDWGSGTSCAGDSPDLAIRSDALGLLVDEVRKGGAQIDPTAMVAEVTKPRPYEAGKLRGAVQASSGAISLQMEDLVTGVGAFPESLPFRRTYSSGDPVSETSGNVPDPDRASLPAVAWNYSGPDSDHFARLGGGWLHNYQISARITADGPKAFGDLYALDASAMIAGVYGLRDLLRNPSLEEWSTGFFAAYWMSQQLAHNAVTVRRGAQSTAFQRLPDGTFNPDDGSPERLTQHGAPVLVYNGYTVKNRDYQPVTFDLVDRDGAKIEFDWEIRTGRGVVPPGSPPPRAAMPVFKATRWTFPNGMQVNFAYDLTTGRTTNMLRGSAASERYVLREVSNSLGRKLTFSRADSGLQYGGDVGWRITKVTDENGREATYTLSGCPSFLANNGAGNLLNTSTMSATAAQAFFACNRLEVRRPAGDVFAYGYDAAADSPVLSTGLRPAYRLRRTFKPDQATAVETVSYDELMRVKGSADGRGFQTVYLIPGLADEFRQQARSITPLNDVTLFTYGERGRLMEVLDPLGRPTRYAYDLAGRQSRKTLPEQNAIAWTYDVRSNVLTETRAPKPGSPLAPVTITRGYGEAPTVFDCAQAKTCNRMAYERDGRDGQTDFHWDAATGNLTEVLRPADPDGQRPQITFGYTSYPGVGGETLSLVTSKTEKISASASTTTRYEYDTQNRLAPLKSVIDDGGLTITTQFTFSARGDLVAADGPGTGAADTINYLWDDDRRLTHVISPSHATTTGAARTAMHYAYRSDGLLQAEEKGVDNAGSAAGFSLRERREYVYDAAGNRVRETLYDGATSNPATITDLSYDESGRVNCTTTRMNLATAGLADGQACTPRSTGDRISQNHYDGADQIKRVEKGIGTIDRIDYMRADYTGNGAKAWVADARGNRTSFTYDGLDRLVRRVLPVSDMGDRQTDQVGSSDPALFEAYDYDANDNRTEVQRRNLKKITYRFDALNRMKEKHLEGDAAHDVYYRYDLLGAMLDARFGSLSGEGTHFEYDRAGRQVRDETFGRGVVSYYDDAGNRRGIVLYDGFSVFYDHDAASLVTGIREQSAPQCPAFGPLVCFTYDDLGRRSHIDRGNGVGGAADYEFDGAGRTRRVAQQGSTADQGLIQQVGYNAASQVNSLVEANPNYVWRGRPSALPDRAYDGLDRDLTLIPLQGGGYDANGNLRTDGVRIFEYDLENRLTKVRPATGQSVVALDLTYDPLGRLSTTVVGPGTASPTLTGFIYDGARLMGEYGGGGAPLRHYVHGPGEDEPLVWFEGSAKRWLHADRQGSIVAWSDGAGTQRTYAYGPWGEPIQWGETRFAYTGQAVLGEAQLYHYKARVYDPMAGRFLQTDPDGFEGGDLNLYAYVGDDPVNRTDPTGKVTVNLGVGGDWFTNAGGGFDIGLTFSAPVPILDPTAKWDVGLFASGRVGVGYLVGAGLSISVSTGSASDQQGTSAVGHMEAGVGVSGSVPLKRGEKPGGEGSKGLGEGGAKRARAPTARQMAGQVVRAVADGKKTVKAEAELGGYVAVQHTRTATLRQAATAAAKWWEETSQRIPGCVRGAVNFCD